MTFASFELDNIKLTLSILKHLGLFLFCDKYKPSEYVQPHEPNSNNFTISRTIVLLSVQKRVGEGLRKTKLQKKKKMKKPNSAHLNVLKTSRTKLIINGTSIQRRANGLAKFARFNEVSLYRGSFSYTLLLLG